jgi:hypothetical protein
MKRLFFIVLPILIPSVLWGKGIKTHCGASEEIAFSCPVANQKTLSLCVAKGFKEKGGNITYRFGPLGKPEFEFHAKGNTASSLFHYRFLSDPDHKREASETTVRFKNGSVTYSIYQNIFDASVEEEGIRILQNDKNTTISCITPSTGNLHILESLYPQETRCGWIDNPTPGNWWIEDREDTWTIGIQGGYQAQGELPDFDKQWVMTNGSHGYGCACMKARVDKNEKEVVSYTDVKILPLQKCKSDPNLKKRKI